MPPVPRAPGSCPPWAGSSTAMCSPPCWVWVQEGEPPDPATRPGVGVAAGLVAAGLLGAGCCACEGVSDGETKAPARSAMHSGPNMETNLIWKMFFTYSSIPNPLHSGVRRSDDQRLQFGPFEQGIGACQIFLLECSPTCQRILGSLFPFYAGGRGIRRGPQFGAVYDDQKPRERPLDLWERLVLLARKSLPKQSKICVTIGLDRRFHPLFQFLQCRQKLAAGAGILLARVDLLSQIAGLLQRYRDFTQSCCKFRRQAELSRQRVWLRFHAWVQLNNQRLRGALAVRRKFHRIVARHRQWSCRAPERSPNALRQRVSKVPDESVHSCVCQKRFRVAHPLHLNWHVVRICLVQDVIARKSPNQLSFGVEDFQLDGR